MEKKYIEDLKEIKDIMNRSARFISLSGLSGVLTGIIALAGAVVANYTFFKDQELLNYNAHELSSAQLVHIILLALITLLLSAGSAIYFTTRKAKKQNLPTWDHQTKRLLINLLIPLITGGLFCLMLLQQGFIGFLPSLTLIFYGLALLNGSKYTLHEIRSLGLFQIILGLLAFQFISYSLIIWALGFGVLHIIYGIMIQRKYKS